MGKKLWKVSLKLAWKKYELLISLLSCNEKARTPKNKSSRKILNVIDIKFCLVKNKPWTLYVEECKDMC